MRTLLQRTALLLPLAALAAAPLEKLGFRCVSGNKHWKLDYANVRMPISKTPSDRRAALNTATDIANRCF